MDPTVMCYLVSKPWWNLPMRKMCENLTRPKLKRQTQPKETQDDWLIFGAA